MKNIALGLHRYVLRSSPALLALSRPASTASAAAQKREGDISDAFTSLSGGSDATPLDQKYSVLKRRLIAGHEERFLDAWQRLLRQLKTDVDHISKQGTNVIPQVDFERVTRDPEALESFLKSYQRYGVAVIRSVLPVQVALDLKQELRDYISLNQSITKGFPKEHPQVYELYWSPPQVKARADPRLRMVQQRLLSAWNLGRDQLPASLRHTISYADRLRLRKPGDRAFALGPHVDGGSVERWELAGYGRAGTYDAIWRGEWDQFDPWCMASRLGVQSDLYHGVGACSAFRAAQGWLAMSRIEAGHGHLLINPMLKSSVAYWLMRPFFAARTALKDSSSTEHYLDERNWMLEPGTTVRQSLIPSKLLIRAVQGARRFPWTRSRDKLDPSSSSAVGRYHGTHAYRGTW